MHTHFILIYLRCGHDLDDSIGLRGLDYSTHWYLEASLKSTGLWAWPLSQVPTTSTMQLRITDFAPATQLFAEVLTAAALASARPQ